MDGPRRGDVKERTFPRMIRSSGPILTYASLCMSESLLCKAFRPIEITKKVFLDRRVVM